MSWREHARPIIARVLADTVGRPDTEVRKALRDAYPFGPRQHHPYKIWLDEIARQRGTKPPLGTRKPAPPATADPRQVDMFPDDDTNA